MKQIARCLGTIVLVAATFVSTSPAAAPPDNSIPIFVIKSNDYEPPPAGGIDIDFLCSLAWRYIDGIDYAGWPAGVGTAVDYCDSTGMLFLFEPGHIGEFKLAGNPDTSFWWARVEALTSASAFKRADYLGDSWVETMTAAAMDSFIDARMNALQTETADFPDVIWFYNVWDEANTNQRNHMTNAYHPYDDYYPNVYTQDTTMTRVDSCSVFSWIKYIEENQYGEIPVTINFGMHHTIAFDDYPGFITDPQSPYYNPPPSGGTFEIQANAVRAFCNMRCQPLGIGGGAGIVQDNYADFICFDYYPFRQVLKDSSLGGDPSATMCDSSWLYLINHFEEGLDSTVLAAAESDIPVFYYAQAFGCGGGPRILYWDTTSTEYTNIEYPSYSAYRPPAPQEFLLDCNLALLHQCKGIFPYSVRSYWEAWSSSTEIPSNFLSCSMLDVDLVPFDTPYENYVYRERITGNYAQDYVSPDSLPPFDGYDPLYSLPSFPDTSGAKGMEHYYEWLFEPYGNLWDSVRDTFGGIAWIAPEMYNLWWYDGYENSVDITPSCSTIVTPEIKLFLDPYTERGYIFYVNRECRYNHQEFYIRMELDSMPGALYYTAGLDHSRRFIIPFDSKSEFFDYYDTLDAGQARLVQLVYPIAGYLPSDLRITRPDVWTETPGDTTNVYDFRYTVGDSIDIYAAVYNLGVVAVDSVAVQLVNVTVPESHVVIARDTLEFDGLSTSGYEVDADTACFRWVPDSLDIGVVRLRIIVASISGESDEDDNSVRFPFLVDPRDYATEIRHDPWDMTEGGFSSWNTDDISDATGWASYTDSVSGMFEGTVEGDSSSSNRLYLDLDGTTDIDGNLYNQVSLACISPEVACDVIIGWTDTGHVSGTDTLYDDLPAGEWVEVGPVDLSGSWSGKTIDSLWLRFSYCGNYNRPIRIGWVLLEEEGS